MTIQSEGFTEIQVTLIFLTTTFLEESFRARSAK